MPWNTLVTLLICLCAASAIGQDTLLFRGLKGPTYFVLSANSITIRLSDTTSTPDALKGTYPEFVSMSSYDRMGPHVFALKVRDSVSVDSLLVKLNGDERVAFALRAAVTPGGAAVFLDNSISIFLHSELIRSRVIANLVDLKLATKPMMPERPGIITVVLGKAELPVYRRILDSISTIEGVRCVIPVYWSRIGLLSIPNDPYWELQYHMFADRQNVENAYGFALRNDSVSIHFFDDVVRNHEDYPQPFSITGYNWADWRSQYNIGPYSKHGIGTTGVVYAKINNAIGIAGFNNINFKVRVQQIVVTENNPLQTYFANNVDIYFAMIDASTQGADIINHSWGFNECEYDDPDGLIAGGVDTSHSLGVLTVAAAGNCNDVDLGCGCVILPARALHALAVGGLHKGTNYRDIGSSYGPELDIMGYFRDVPTLSLMESQEQIAARATTDIVCTDLPTNYRCMSGTSIASPQVAAIAGLVLAKRPDFKNKPDTLSKILRYSTDDGAAPCALDTFRHDDEIGYGRVDAYRALHSVSRGNVDNSGIIDLSDLVSLCNYLTIGQPIPQPDLYIGDINCDCSVNLSDLSALVAYLTQGVRIPLCFRFPN